MPIAMGRSSGRLQMSLRMLVRVASAVRRNYCLEKSGNWDNSGIYFGRWNSRIFRKGETRSRARTRSGPFRIDSVQSLAVRHDSELTCVRLRPHLGVLWVTHKCNSSSSSSCTGTPTPTPSRSPRVLGWPQRKGAKHVRSSSRGSYSKSPTAKSDDRHN